MRAENDNGANIVAQIALRGNGIIMGWQATLNPFMFRPAWGEIAMLPWEELKLHPWRSISTPVLL